MTISIKHAKTSAKGDGGDATLIRPSDWNAEHVTSMATNRLIGRLTIGAGAFEEIPISALIAAALDETTGEAFLAALGVGGFETGDVKYTVNSADSAGWVRILSSSTTIGKVGSGATYADPGTEALYTLCWNNISNTYCPVSGGRGANAAADFAAGKTLQLPWLAGRAPVGVGGGGGLTTRNLGEYGGAETHALTTGELASHFHSAAISDPTHAHTLTSAGGNTSTPGGSFSCSSGVTTIGTNASATGVRLNSANGLDTTNSSGSGTAHNNMSPFIPLVVKVKL